MKVDLCIAACPETSPDSDGDGLSDGAEQCVGTSVSVIDSDGDGMPDGFEHEYGLDPLGDDADADQDGDEYTNLEEFIGKSDPTHAASPHPVYFVSPDGADEATGGTPSNLWRTVRFAMEHLTPASDGTAQLVLHEGGYDEDVALRPGITLAAAINATVIIAGRMTGAEATTLKRLTLAPGPETNYILDMNDVAMTLEQVTIEGFAVINERDEVIVMQDNYWGVTDTALFPTRVSGVADVLPILYQSSSVIASTFLCTIWEGTTQKRISSASVALKISPFDDVRENSNGVYAFPCLQDGEYSLIIDAAGYRRHTAQVSLRPGEVCSVSVALEAISDDGAEPHIDNLLPLLAGCNAGANGDTSVGGDLIVLLFVLASLGLWQRRSNTSARHTT